MKHQFPLSKTSRIITAILLLWALDYHPYSYYILLRWFVCFVSVYMAYISYVTDKREWMIMFIFIALLFNPLFPVYLDRPTWAIIDVITSFVMLTSLLLLPRKSQSVKNI
jgi:hypothetical protein